MSGERIDDLAHVAHALAKRAEKRIQDNMTRCLQGDPAFAETIAKHKAKLDEYNALIQARDERNKRWARERSGELP